MRLALTVTVLVCLLLVALMGCASKEGEDSTTLQAPPADAPLVRDEPLQCPDGRLLYLHVYDLNPATQAGLWVIGRAMPTAPHGHGDPLLVIEMSDDGVDTWHLLLAGQVLHYTGPEWLERYGGTGGASVCRALSEKEA